jgi:RHS repeat-associated protein
VYDHALSPLDIKQRVIQGQQPSLASVQLFDRMVAEGGMLWVRDERHADVEYGAFELTAGGQLAARPDYIGAYDGFGTLDARGMNLLLVGEGVRGDFLYRRIPSGVSSGLVKTASGGLSETWTYTFDEVSNITAVAKPAGSESYGYDNLDRLDTFTLPGSSAVDYSYDLVGNRLSVSQTGVTSNLTYASSANRLINNAGVAISSDANGNPLTDGGESYTYNARNRLVQVSDSSGVVASYAYNALGQRVNKVAGSADIDFVYDLNGLLLGEYANGLLIREYVHGPNGPVAQIESDGSVLTLHTDHLGTPRAATDANQTVVWRWEGKPFGESAADEDPDGDMNAVTVNLRFPGQYFDMETGKHYNYFRDYDPSVGRYIQSDPIGLAGGSNTYTYVHGNPTNFVDFYGLDASLYPKDP